MPERSEEDCGPEQPQAVREARSGQSPKALQELSVHSARCSQSLPPHTAALLQLARVQKATSVQQNRDFPSDKSHVGENPPVTQPAQPSILHQAGPPPTLLRSVHRRFYVKTLSKHSVIQTD